MNRMDAMKTPAQYLFIVLLSNFEGFRLLNLEVFEALLLIKKLLIKNWVYYFLDTVIPPIPPISGLMK